METANEAVYTGIHVNVSEVHCTNNALLYV